MPVVAAMLVALLSFPICRGSSTTTRDVCPAQTLKDEGGVERHWPPLKLGEVFFFKKDACVEAVRRCSWSETRGLYLAPPRAWSSGWPAPCDVTEINISKTVNVLQTIANKTVVSPTDLVSATSMVNDILQMNRTVLTAARQDVGSVLQTLDAVLTRVQLAPGQSVQSVQPQLAVFVVNVQKQPPLALVLQGGAAGLRDSSVRTVRSQEELADVDVAVLVSQSLASLTSHVSLAVFGDDAAFRDPALNGSRVDGFVVSVATGTGLQRGQHVDILFRPRERTGAKRCVFWDWRLSGGGWSGAGCELVTSSLHDVCRCYHLTHFAELVTPPGVEADPVLDVVSVVGCSLSLAGLLGIFLTGAVFRQWRAQLGNKILLHLSAAVALNMAAFLTTAAGLHDAPCIALGALLHYSVLASFCWMLVSAGLQFLRLVSVFDSPHVPHLLLKAALFSWGVPLLPVAALLAVDVRIYAADGRGFCYPGGLAFYLAVLCPVVMVLTSNVLVFGMILWRICARSAVTRHVRSERSLVLRRVATSVLLFFLLGLSWLFGLLAGLSRLCAYLFCLTATLQGFVLFLFFVVIEKKSRRCWTSSAGATSSTPAERVTLRQSDSTRL